MEGAQSLRLHTFAVPLQPTATRQPGHHVRGICLKVDGDRGPGEKQMCTRASLTRDLGDNHSINLRDQERRDTGGGAYLPSWTMGRSWVLSEHMSLSGQLLLMERF